MSWRHFRRDNWKYEIFIWCVIFFSLLSLSYLLLVWALKMCTLYTVLFGLIQTVEPDNKMLFTTRTSNIMLGLHKNGSFSFALVFFASFRFLSKDSKNFAIFFGVFLWWKAISNTHTHTQFSLFFIWVVLSFFRVLLLLVCHYKIYGWCSRSDGLSFGIPVWAFIKMPNVLFDVQIKCATTIKHP